MQGKGTEITGRVIEIANDLKGLEGPLLPILHAVQSEFGFVPKESLPALANLLNISRAEIHGVVSFYHDFREESAGKHVLKVCRAEACQSMGGDALSERVRALLGVDWHGTTADGKITLEPVYCLGLCACAPAAMLDDTPVARLDDAKVSELVAEASR